MIIDIICILIFALFAYLGYKKGFMRSVFTFFSFFIALVLAFTLEPVVSDALEKTPIASSIKEVVHEQLMGKDDQEILELQNETLIDYVDSEVERTTSGLREEVADAITRTIIRIISILLLVIVVRVLIHVISIILKTASHLPIIHTFDSGLGVVFGILTAYIVISLLCLLLDLCKMTSIASPIIEALNSSFIGKFFYENNFVFHSFLDLG